MQQYIDGLRIANSVMMLRRQHTGSVVLVEGDSDARFYHKHFVKDCRIIPAINKKNVLQAIAELGNRKVKGVLGVVDCDYLYLENRLSNHPNIVYTDFHDLETLLILSPSLENFLRELTPGDKLHLIDDVSKKVREVLFSLGLEIGYLRWASFRENLGLNFKDLPYSQIADPVRIVVDAIRLIRTTSINIRPPVNIADIEHKMVELKKRKADYKHVCQGHDLVYLLELVIPVVFENVFGKNFANTIRPKCKSFIFDDGLRLGYENTFFVSTKLYVAIKDWENKNSSFKILV